MSRLAKDPELNQLAAQLRTLEWTTPLPQDEVDQLTEIANSPDGKRRHVVPMPGYTDWLVRFYLGGDHRTIGFAKFDDVASAMRFADMAEMKFWSYRIRGAAPPDELRLNRRRADVESDMVNEVFAVQLLDSIEQHLISSGALKTAAMRELERKERKRSNLRTITGQNHLEVMEKLESALSELQAVREEHAKVLGELAALQKTQGLVTEALKAIAGMVAKQAV